MGCTLGISGQAAATWIACSPTPRQTGGVGRLWIAKRPSPREPKSVPAERLTNGSTSSAYPICRAWGLCGSGLLMAAISMMTPSGYRLWLASPSSFPLPANSSDLEEMASKSCATWRYCSRRAVHSAEPDPRRASSRKMVPCGWRSFRLETTAATWPRASGCSTSWRRLPALRFRNIDCWSLAAVTVPSQLAVSTESRTLGACTPPQ